VIDEAFEYVPKLTDFGFMEEEIPKHDKRSCYQFVGGEDRGLKRLNEYLFEKKAVKHYNKTRNQLIGANYSSKLSPWLACGALSPRKIYFDLRQFEQKCGGNEDTKVFFDELMWRDFNRYWCMNKGNKIFSEYGIYDREYYNWKTDM